MSLYMCVVGEGVGGGTTLGPDFTYLTDQRWLTLRLRVHVWGETCTFSVRRFNRGTVIAVVITVVNQVAQSC